MRSRLVTFFISFIIWQLLCFSPDSRHLLVGFFVSLLVALTMGDMFTKSAHKWFNPRRYLWFMIWIFVFAWECLKANLDVACRVLNPKLPIKPGVVKIKTNLKTETGLTFLANFITLTPGTFTIDVDRENGYFYIHWINVETQDSQKATEIISAKFERILKEVFE